jgi:gluconate 2-dehydrogenase alpha chain
VLRLTTDWNDNERNMIGFLFAKMVAAGPGNGPGNGGPPDRARQIVPPSLACRYDVTTYRNTHLQGRDYGANPGNSVVNRWLQHWQMSNLFVLSASTFPQNPSGNPTLTILAQTLRTADAIVERYVKRPGLLA